MAEWDWDCSKRLLGTSPVEEFFVEFWVHDKKVGLQAAAAQKSSKRPDI